MNRRVSVTVDADLSPFNRAMLGGVASARSFAHELETADSRFANIVQTGLALAPALVPLGAIGVPAVAGLAAQLGATAAAAGVTVLAFQGVGDALKALNQYQIDPTDAHLKKLNETMDALGPSGELLVRTLQQIRPEMQELQDIAQEGMFPGLTNSIYELQELEPEVESIIGTISRTLGDLAEAGAEELTTDRWVDFIGFLDKEARPTLSAMAKALGYTVEGLASMMMEFDPLADDFTQGMVGYARSFRDWADGLDDSETFEDFVDYIQQNGPEALDTLAALAGALVSLVAAAAPVGAAVLPVIETLANALSAIADSNVGPLLIGVAAGVGTLGRALALMEAVGLRSGESLLARIFAVDKLKAGSAAMLEVTSAQDRARLSATQLAAAEEKRAAAFRAGAAQFGRNAALLGGLTLAMTGYADKTGLSNTATYALMGTIAGPWGAAIGGGIGLAMDFASANNDLEQAIRSADRAADDFDLENMRAAVESLGAAIDSQEGKLSAHLLTETDPTKLFDNLTAFTSGVNELFTHSLDEARAKQQELEESTTDLTLGINALGQAFGATRAGEYVEDLDRLTPILERARPAMEALGISTGDLAAAVRDGSIVELVGQISDYTQWMDSAAGRTARVAEAMRGLDDQMTSTKQSATDLKTALDALLDPQLNLVRATDEWTTALRHLEDDLDKNNKTLSGNSDAAIKNREAVNQRVDSLKQLLGAEADAGASTKELATKLRDQRKALIDAAAAAGISRDQMRDYLKTLGLTPKLVRTLIEARTDEALAAVRRIKAELDNIPRSISTRYYVTQINAINKGPVTGPGSTNALGNIHPGDVANRHLPELSRNPVTRIWNEPETGGESYIPHANDYRRPRAKAILEQTASMFNGEVRWYANGGVESSRPSLDTRLEILRIEQQIRDLGRDLDARIKKGDRKGQHQLTGIDREIARLELEAAQRELRRAKHAEERELRQGIREALGEFDLGTGMGPVKDLPLSAQYAAQTRQEFRDLRQQILAAGGELPKGFDRIRDRAVELSEKLGIATKKYDDANEALTGLQASAADMKAAVAGIFNNDIFAKGGLANTMLQLEADSNDTRERDRLLQMIGASGGIDKTSESFKALATNADMQTLRDLDTLAEIKAYDAAYMDRYAAQQAAGSYAATAAYAPLISKQEAIVAQQGAKIDQLLAALETNQQKIATGVQSASGLGSYAGSKAGAREGVAAGLASQEKKANSKARTR